MRSVLIGPEAIGILAPYMIVILGVNCECNLRGTGGAAVFKPSETDSWIITEYAGNNIGAALLFIGAEAFVAGIVSRLVELHVAITGFITFTGVRRLICTNCIGEAIMCLPNPLVIVVYGWIVGGFPS
jgi:hypothetical protein